MESRFEAPISVRPKPLFWFWSNTKMKPKPSAVTVTDTETTFQWENLVTDNLALVWGIFSLKTKVVAEFEIFLDYL